MGFSSYREDIQDAIGERVRSGAMQKIEDLTLSDNTGEKHTFEVYPKETEFSNRNAGVYVFTKRSEN